MVEKFGGDGGIDSILENIVFWVLELLEVLGEDRIWD